MEDPDNFQVCEQRERTPAWAGPCAALKDGATRREIVPGTIPPFVFINILGWADRPMGKLFVFFKLVAQGGFSAFFV